jgi:hypothetical protein
MTDEELKRELERLRKENEELKAKSSSSVDLRVSQKGGVSLYGMRRFPITFYKDEWIRILDMADGIRAFIVEHDAELSSRKGKE